MLGLYERTCVGYLIDNIECSDSYLCSAIAVIKLYDTSTGLQNVNLLIPVDPVGNKTKVKRPLANISSTSSFKSCRRLSVVEFRYYKPEEYTNLNKA